ncbi:TRI25 ligase, partial [Polypterus senegalus]
MAAAKEDGVDERTMDIKEEDCERLTPEDVCVKLEDHEERISVFKEEEECKGVTAAIKAEDLNDFSVGLELQKYETKDIFKQDACEESPSSLQPWSTNTGRLATQENSVELKSELSESEEKITEGNGREGEESPGNVGINLQKNGSFSPPLFGQPSLQYKEKDTKKSARGSENLTAAFLQCSSLPASVLTQTEAIKTDRQQAARRASEESFARQAALRGAVTCLAAQCEQLMEMAVASRKTPSETEDRRGAGTRGRQNTAGVVSVAVPVEQVGRFAEHGCDRLRTISSKLMMAEAQLFVSQDEFTCSVCLDTLTDPVTIPFGHSFCLKCLMDCWDQSQLFSCPQCRENFTTRPTFRRNSLLNEILKKFKKTGLSSPPPQNYAGPGDVECDFCTGKNLRVVKSCLTCPASYCQTHLQPHYEVAAWKDHKLVDPDRNLKEKLCEKHQKILEIFCETDNARICMMCGVNEHNGHKIVKLETVTEEKEKQTLSDIKRRLEEREKTLKETRRVMEEMKISVERDMEENEKSFSALIWCTEEVNRKLTERIREQEKRQMEKAEGVMEQLEKEIEELKRREAELKELSETKDHLHFLQTFSSRCVLPADGDSLDFTAEDLRKELSGLIKTLENISRWVIMTWTPSGNVASQMFAHRETAAGLNSKIIRAGIDKSKELNGVIMKITSSHRLE